MSFYFFVIKKTLKTEQKFETNIRKELTIKNIYFIIKDNLCQYKILIEGVKCLNIRKYVKTYQQKCMCE